MEPRLFTGGFWRRHQRKSSYHKAFVNIFVEQVERWSKTSKTVLKPSFCSVIIDRSRNLVFLVPFSIFQLFFLDMSWFKKYYKHQWQKTRRNPQGRLKLLVCISVLVPVFYLYKPCVFIPFHPLDIPNYVVGKTSCNFQHHVEFCSYECRILLHTGSLFSYHF